MKKGFTLIELLSVIVILAIIALIVTPVVSNIVANARIAANARSVEGHIRNIEIAIISEAFSGTSTGDLDSFDTITSGATIESRLSVPDNDNVTCETYVISHGTVITADKCKDIDNKWGKKYTYSNSEGAVVYESFKGTIEAPKTGETHLGIVYMDPTNPKTVCTSTSTITTTASGCKKFYIYKEDGIFYYMLNDRNLVDDIAYNASLNNMSQGTAFVTALENATEGWNNSGTSRLITVDEVAAIVGADTAPIAWSSTKTYKATPDDITTQSSWFYFDGGRNSNPAVYSSSSNGWQKKYANITTKSIYSWLYDYTETCNGYGCNISLSSGSKYYWTSSAVSGTTNFVWTVSYEGKLTFQGASNAHGIRPVLVIPKSLIG